MHGKPVQPRCGDCRIFKEIAARRKEVWPEGEKIPEALYCDRKETFVLPMCFCRDGEWDSEVKNEEA